MFKSFWNISRSIEIWGELPCHAAFNAVQFLWILVLEHCEKKWKQEVRFRSHCMDRDTIKAFRWSLWSGTNQDRDDAGPWRARGEPELYAFGLKLQEPASYINFERLIFEHLQFLCVYKDGGTSHAHKISHSAKLTSCSGNWRSRIAGVRIVQIAIIRSTKIAITKNKFAPTWHRFNFESEQLSLRRHSFLESLKVVQFGACHIMMMRYDRSFHDKMFLL